MDLKRDREQINVLYHNRAGEAMLTLYREFKQSIGAIDRQWDENVFQRQQGMYTAQLKRRLDDIALEMMNMLDTSEERNEWSYTASRFITEYMREFAQKIRSL